jgi:hypothetical protein
VQTFGKEWENGLQDHKPKTRKGNQIMKDRNIRFKPPPGLLIPVLLGCFAMSPEAQAVDPPPDGGYPGGNTAEGKNALFSVTAGGKNNTAVGFQALYNNTTGDGNTGLGARALINNITGINNTAVGAAALLNNNGSLNTATGNSALLSNTSGSGNTATGDQALLSNTIGDGNTAVGSQALLSNTIGLGNTAVGANALYNNTTGQNTAIGESALYLNTQGELNTAVGSVSLFLNSTGDQNTAIGHQALTNNTTGENNTAIGFQALSNNATGNSNTAVGHNAGANVVTASNVTCIGSNAAGADVSNTTWIANVYGVPTQNGTTAPVIVAANGQLGTVASSERFKKDIATMEKTSEAVLLLRPVTFHYKTDTKGTPQFGLIAEEVAKVNPALVLPDKEGKPYTVRYDAVNTMLLNEFLKEHREVQGQKATISEFKKEIANLTATVKEQAAQIQKVSAQIEVTKPRSAFARTTLK